MNQIENNPPATSAHPTSPEPQRRPAPHPVYWLIAGALATIAISQLTNRNPALQLSGSAFAQPTTSAGARGVFAFSGQLTKSTYGVYVVDTDTATMWMYEYNGTKGCLRLAASRSWRFDRYLENHNLCDLPPETVEQMIEEQRVNRKQAEESKTP